MVAILAKVCETFENAVKKWMNSLVEENRELEWLTQAAVFQTYDSPENLSQGGQHGSNAVKVALLAKQQVNDRNFDGLIRPDGRLFGRDVFEKSVLVSAW